MLRVRRVGIVDIRWRPRMFALFPYTTLFRSLKGAMLLRLWADQPYRATVDLDLLSRGNPDPDSVARDIAAICRDRKSTRLNSSHSQNSYAVLCLKKENPELDVVTPLPLGPAG